MRDWQPISTAPKDRTDVILAFQGKVGMGRWLEGAKPGWYACGWAPNVQATHWMPLPDPPSVGETPQ